MPKTRSKGPPPQDDVVETPEKPVAAPRRRATRAQKADATTANNKLVNTDTETPAVVPKRKDGKASRSTNKRSCPESPSPKLSASAAQSDGSGLPPVDPGEAEGTSGTQDPDNDCRPPAPKRTRKAATTAEPVKRQLPARSKKPQHPGLPAAPRPKRSSEEVQASKDRLRALQEETKLLDQQRREALAKLENLEREAAEAEDDTVIRTWDDEFDKDRMVIDDDEHEVPAKPQVSKKRQRGDLRRDVEALKQTMGGADIEEEDVAVLDNSPPKKTASALVPGWRSRVSWTAGHLPAAGPVPELDEFDVGGLNDDDINDNVEVPVCNGAKGKGKAKCAPRSAQLVLALPVPVPAPKTASARAQAKKAAASVKKITPAAPRGGTKTVKAESVDIPVAAVASSSGAHSNISADIPEFLRGSWVSKALPTLAHGLYASGCPFGPDFSKNSSLLKLVQRCVVAVVPGTTYKVTAKDRVFERAYSSIINKRHAFIDEAREYLAGLMNPLSGTARIDLFNELIQPGSGTALYSDISGTTPKGLGESVAFSHVFGAAVKDTLKKSSGDFGLKLPGAFGLTAAALCMASEEWSSGAYVKSTWSFSNENVGGDVRAYSALSVQLTDKAWRRIHGAAKTKTFGAAGGPALPAPLRRVANPLSAPLHIPTSSPEHSEQEGDNEDEDVDADATD